MYEELGVFWKRLKAIDHPFQVPDITWTVYAKYHMITPRYLGLHEKEVTYLYIYI